MKIISWWCTVSHLLVLFLFHKKLFKLEICYFFIIIIFPICHCSQTGLLLSEVSETEQKDVDKIEKIFTNKKICKIAFNNYVIIY